MKILFKKEKSVIEKITKYFRQVDRCRDEFRKTMQVLITEKRTRHHADLAAKVRGEESLADDIRRDIEHELYRKALIPESRGDVLGLLETIDTIPGLFESVCDEMCLEQIEAPKKIAKDLIALTDTNIEAYDMLSEVCIAFFYKKDIIEDIMRIDKKESESDAMERKLIERIFKLEIEKADKILLKDTVKNIGKISDASLTAADRLTLAVIKRQV